MTPLLTAAQMRRADQATIDGFGLPGMVLMERAALALTQAVLNRHPTPGKVLCIAGGGNNGGDALAVARQLHQAGWKVSVVDLPESRVGDSLAQRRMLRKLPVTFLPPEQVLADSSLLAGMDLWVDGLFGIGLRDAPRGMAAQLLETLSTVLPAALPPWGVWAIDLPSGVRADTGETFACTLSARVTVACGALKWAHVLPPALDACGEVLLADLGIPTSVLSALDEPPAHSLAPADMRTWLHPTPRSAWKGSRGHVVVLAGSPRYIGAAMLTCRAALRAGAGRVTLVSEASCADGIRAHTPEVIWAPPEDLATLLEDADAAAAGPGLLLEPATRSLLERVAAWKGPRVFDATALRWLGDEQPPLAAPEHVVLTPHPGELAALLQSDTADVLCRLPQAAQACSDQWRTTCIVKTAGSIVASIRGPLMHVPADTPSAGVAGSGDVLTGIVAAFLVHHEPDKAAPLAASLHTRAAAIATPQGARNGLLASDIIEALPQARAALDSVEPTP